MRLSPHDPILEALSQAPGGTPLAEDKHNPGKFAGAIPPWNGAHSVLLQASRKPSWEIPTGAQTRHTALKRTARNQTEAVQAVLKNSPQQETPIPIE
ncbi:MAG: hypothetical protein CMJ86_00775 [Planctomycetes bacterium]|nr:hypothetical protein [Planctomycetota bacterium]